VQRADGPEVFLVEGEQARGTGVGWNDLPRLPGQRRARGSPITDLGRTKRGKSSPVADKIDEMSTAQVATPDADRLTRSWAAERREGEGGNRGIAPCRADA